MPFYPTEPKRINLFPTDLSSRDPLTGMAVSIGFSPFRGRGISVRSGLSERYIDLIPSVTDADVYGNESLGILREFPQVNKLLFAVPAHMLKHRAVLVSPNQVYDVPPTISLVVAQTNDTDAPIINLGSPRVLPGRCIIVRKHSTVSPSLPVTVKATSERTVYFFNNGETQTVYVENWAMFINDEELGWWSFVVS